MKFYQFLIFNIFILLSVGVDILFLKRNTNILFENLTRYIYLKMLMCQYSIWNKLFISNCELKLRQAVKCRRQLCVGTFLQHPLYSFTLEIVVVYKLLVQYWILIYQLFKKIFCTAISNKIYELEVEQKGCLFKSSIYYIIYFFILFWKRKSYKHFIFFLILSVINCMNIVRQFKIWYIHWLLIYTL